MLDAVVVVVILFKGKRHTQLAEFLRYKWHNKNKGLLKGGSGEVIPDPGLPQRLYDRSSWNFAS